MLESIIVTLVVLFVVILPTAMYSLMKIEQAYRSAVLAHFPGDSR